MQTSNYWDPIGDMNEAFEIVDIRGFKKIGLSGLLFRTIQTEDIRCG